MGPEAKPRLLVLDGMRGAAAVLVVLHHGAGALGHPGVFGRGYLAVDFFFLLSGFVLSRAFEDRLRTGSLGPAAFLSARLCRLWPAAAFGAVLGALILVARGAPARQAAELLAPTLLLIPRLHGTEPVFALDGPLWSLLFELAANLIHAVWLRRLGDRGLALLVCVLFVALAVATLRVGNAAMGDLGSTFPFGFARVGFPYALGVLLARHGTRVGSVPPGWAIPACALPLTIVGAPLLPLTPPWGDLLLIALAFPLLLLLGANAHAAPRWNRVLSGLGAVSFPLYVVHVPILDSLRGVAEIAPPTTHGAFQAGFLTLSFGAAVLISRTPLARGFDGSGSVGRAGARARDRVAAVSARWRLAIGNERLRKPPPSP
jgi:peptidoglycan/LPS O-acetylase OafA/YrhL